MSDTVGKVEPVVVEGFEITTIYDGRISSEVRRTIVELLLHEMKELGEKFSPLNYSKMITRVYKEEIIPKFQPESHALLYASVVSERLGALIFPYWEQYQIELAPKANGNGYRATRRLPKGIQTTLLDETKSEAKSRKVAR